MGKYMRKGKGVGKMEVSQGTLVGVRTRAKSLALQQEQMIGHRTGLRHSLATSAATISDSKISGNSSHTLSEQPLYMELRSRKLEKGVRGGKGKDNEEIVHNDMPELCKNSSGGTLFSPLSQELRSFDHERRSLWLQAGSCSLQCSDSTSRNRLASGSPHLCLPGAPTGSSNHSIGQSTASMAQKTPLGILTRNRRQELVGCSALNSEAAVGLEAVLAPHGHVESFDKGHAENSFWQVEVCFGESPMVADACNNISECDPSSMKRMRACTPDSFVRDMEAPGSTSKPRSALQVRRLPPTVFAGCSDSPIANEIEAFLSSAEQRERRRFINRFNFDPLLEKPLRGRYQWFKL